MIWHIKLVLRDSDRASKHIINIPDQYFGFDMLRSLQKKLSLTPNDLEDVSSQILGIKRKHHEIPVSVPLAFASGRFRESSMIEIEVEPNFLEDFVVYDAVSKKITKEVYQHSFQLRINEASVITYWEECGFPLFLNRPKIQDNE